MRWWTLRQLRSGDVAKRVEAVRKLSTCDEPEVVAALVEMLDDPTYSVEMEATEALVRVGTPCIQPLLAALNHPSERRRLYAASILKQVVPNWENWDKKDEVVGMLIGSVSHRDPAIRRAAVDELAELGHWRATKHLAAALCDDSSEVRQSAAQGLEKLLNAMEDATPIRAARGKIASVAEAVPGLIAVMCRNRPSSREYETAVRTLARIGPGTLDALLEMLSPQNNVTTRLAVVETLGFMRDPNALPQLAAVLKDPSPAVRLSAARALGQYACKASADALLTALKDVDVNVRITAAQSLLQVESGSQLSVAIPGLLGALRDRAPSIRRNAASLLAAIGDPRAAGDLVLALNDRDEEVRKSAAEALVRIGKKAASQLIGALRDRNPAVRSSALQVLGKIGLREAVVYVTALLKDPDSSVRATAAEVLKMFADENCVPAFVEALSDVSPAVRGRAAGALAELGAESAVAPLMQAAKMDDGTPECLAALITIMALRAAKVETEDLRSMADFSTSGPSLPGTRPATVPSEEAMNCSALRQLAREELALRGIRV
jgi:HEAT repeat protein